MLLIYTHKITPRFSYIMKHIFTGMHGIEISFTTTVEDFIKHNGPKITYTRQPLQNEFFIRSNDLLFEQGINDFQITVGDWEGVPCFFAAGEKSKIPYDIFAASFYLISRYEEYLPHVKDLHRRFPPSESLAFKNNFLLIPVVDIWVFKLLEALGKRFPEIRRKRGEFLHTSLVDVTTSHCYANRGLIRGMAGLVLDLFHLRLRRVWERLSVWLKLRKDPFDNFSALIALHKVHKVESMFFFQFASYSTYDKNVSIYNNSFRFLIKSVADYCKVCLAASYSSFGDVSLLKQEKKNLSNVINRPVSCARMRYNRVDVPNTYRNLVDAEFTDDFSMGYTHEIGFRAGTCTPFYFYDVPLEVQQPLRVHPFAVHDYAFQYMNSTDDILQAIDGVGREVARVEGDFLTVFSNELLGGHQKVDWMQLYTKMIRKYHV